MDISNMTIDPYLLQTAATTRGQNKAAEEQPANEDEARTNETEETVKDQGGEGLEDKTLQGKKNKAKKEVKVKKEQVGRPEMPILEGTDIKQEVKLPECWPIMHKSTKEDLLVRLKGKNGTFIQAPFKEKECGCIFLCDPKAPPRRYIPEEAADEEGRSLRHYLIHQRHNALLHTGLDRTYNSMRTDFYWPQLKEHCTEIVRTCDVCQRNKKSTALPPGEAKVMPIPRKFWDSISMDFYGPLTPSKGFHNILVMLDRLSGEVILVPLPKKYSAKDTADAYLKHVYPKAGLASEILSDRDTRFTSAFWQTIQTALDTKLYMATPFHQNTNGQVEHVMKQIGEALRIYTQANPSSWSDILHFVQAAINHTPSPIHKRAPSHILYARESRTLPDEHTIDASKFPLADQWINDAIENAAAVRDALTAARYRNAKYASKRRNPKITFKVGDLVLHKRNNYSKKTPTKLQSPWVGPFQIIEKDDATGNCKLKLPKKRGKKVYPWFAQDKLRKYYVGDQAQAGKIAEEIGDMEDYEEEFEVEEILDSRDVEADGQLRKEYKVRWMGYDEDDDTWEPIENLENAKDTIEAFENRKNPNNPKSAAILFEEFIPEVGNIIQTIEPVKARGLDTSYLEESTLFSEDSMDEMDWDGEDDIPRNLYTCVAGPSFWIPSE